MEGRDAPFCVRNSQIESGTRIEKIRKLFSGRSRRRRKINVHAYQDLHVNIRQAGSERHKNRSSKHQRNVLRYSILAHGELAGLLGQKALRTFQNSIAKYSSYFPVPAQQRFGSRSQDVLRTCIWKSTGSHLHASARLSWQLIAHV